MSARFYPSIVRHGIGQYETTIHLTTQTGRECIFKAKADTFQSAHAKMRGHITRLVHAVDDWRERNGNK